MSVSEAFSTFLKLRRVAVILSIALGGTTYKVGPKVWHKAHDEINARPEIKTSATNISHPVLVATTSTNATGDKVSDCDLGLVTLTNHYETCVKLGANQDCLLTPNLIDSKNVQLTVTVESRRPNGKIHDLSITQVMAKPGKPFEVAVGAISFSLIPDVTSASE